MKMIGALRVFASPIVLLTLIAAGILALLPFGPIAYPGLPSLRLIILTIAGLLLFATGQFGGIRLAQRWSSAWAGPRSARADFLGKTVSVSAILGIIGIACIVADRDFLSGMNNADYAAFLRCAPEFIDYVAVSRTPLIYVGYLLFSFGFVSLTLFLVFAEEIHGWPAALAQIAVLSPVGYALTYSGRMPILLQVGLLLAAGLVRLRLGRTLIPRGHYLIPKILIFAVAFAIYNNSIWESRRNFCREMGPVVALLKERVVAQRDAMLKEKMDRLAARDAEEEGTGTGRGKIGRKLLAQMIEEQRQLLASGKLKKEISADLDVDTQWPEIISGLEESWNVKIRGYIIDAVKDKSISPRTLVRTISNYFYLTHGTMTFDRIWSSRGDLFPVLGLYEIGVLSPLLRVFLPDSDWLWDMSEALKSSDIYGFFPSVWGAALVDFGLAGGILYVLLWGLAGGWAYRACAYENLILPPIVLCCVLATVILSPLQGPLGIANSALVLGSTFVLGGLVDYLQLRRRRLTASLPPDKFSPATKAAE